MDFLLKTEWASTCIEQPDLASFLDDFGGRLASQRIWGTGGRPRLFDFNDIETWIYTDKCQRDFMLRYFDDHCAFLLSGIDEVGITSGYYGVGEPFVSERGDRMPLGEIVIERECLDQIDVSDILEGLHHHAVRDSLKINQGNLAFESEFDDRRGRGNPVFNRLRSNQNLH